MKANTQRTTNKTYKKSARRKLGEVRLRHTGDRLVETVFVFQWKKVAVGKNAPKPHSCALILHLCLDIWRRESCNVKLEVLYRLTVHSFKVFAECSPFYYNAASTTTQKSCLQVTLTIFAFVPMRFWTSALCCALSMSWPGLGASYLGKSPNIYFEKSHAARSGL